MRLHFKLSPNLEPVPFAYQHRLTGVFHKWLTKNDLHDKISLYSLSWLDGSRRRGRHLHFPDGASWLVSFYEDEFAEKLVNGALNDPEMFCGMRVENIYQQVTPDLGSRQTLKVASPVFIKGKMPANGRPPHHYLFNEPESDTLMTNTLVHKMNQANIETKNRQNNGEKVSTPPFTEEDKQVKVAFDRDFPNPKPKLVRILKFAKGDWIAIDCRASICPVTIEGTPKALQFAWNVGIGNGTGSCFGSLKEDIKNA